MMGLAAELSGARLCMNVARATLDCVFGMYPYTCSRSNTMYGLQHRMNTGKTAAKRKTIRVLCRYTIVACTTNTIFIDLLFYRLRVDVTGKPGLKILYIEATGTDTRRDHRRRKKEKLQPCSRIRNLNICLILYYHTIIRTYDY